MNKLLRLLHYIGEIRPSSYTSQKVRSAQISVVLCMFLSSGISCFYLFNYSVKDASHFYLNIEICK